MPEKGKEPQGGDLPRPDMSIVHNIQQPDLVEQVLAPALHCRQQLLVTTFAVYQHGPAAQ